ncbi:hypothetical protein [Paenibacillus sp. FSL H8-0537]|uniref:hypothetical protein n=1 Tax=Paenibacillus sp. FSL H8-0537 TaxID=2921399 RepID=UPI00310132F0
MELNKFVEVVDRSFTLESKTELELMCGLLKEQVNLQKVTEWLSELRQESEDQLGNLASLMEIHPLGFEKYVLWNSEDSGIRGRLHYWPQNKWPFESIHDHRFNFAVILLCGEYTHEEYKVTELEMDKVEIELTRSSKVIEGDTYFFEAGSFHRVIPSNEMTLSLIVRSKAILPFSRVINPDDLKMRKAYGNVKKFKDRLLTLENALI